MVTPAEASTNAQLIEENETEFVGRVLGAVNVRLAHDALGGPVDVELARLAPNGRVVVVVNEDGREIDMDLLTLHAKTLEIAHAKLQRLAAADNVANERTGRRRAERLNVGHRRRALETARVAQNANQGHVGRKEKYGDEGKRRKRPRPCAVLREVNEHGEGRTQRLGATPRLHFGARRRLWRVDRHSCCMCLNTAVLTERGTARFLVNSHARSARAASLDS